MLFIIAVAFDSSVFAQRKGVPASAGREEYIEVEKNVRLHVTDLDEGQPIVLIHGWPFPRDRTSPSEIRANIAFRWKSIGYITSDKSDPSESEGFFGFGNSPPEIRCQNVVFDLV